MELLRAVLKRALADREPTAAEWDADFQQVQRKLRRRALNRWEVIVPAACLTATVLITISLLPPAHVPGESAPMQIYLRVDNEPEESALSIQMIVHSGVLP